MAPSSEHKSKPSKQRAEIYSMENFVNVSEERNCFHFKGRSFLSYILTLKTEAILSSETSFNIY
jgi:hypothetical protein